MTKEEKYAHWEALAIYDLETADAMLKSGRYMYVAFTCQQAIEKLSKKVQQYEQILQKDISRIQQTGQEMVQQDEKLGKDLKDSSAHRAM